AIRIIAAEAIPRETERNKKPSITFLFNQLEDIYVNGCLNIERLVKNSTLVQLNKRVRNNQYRQFAFIGILTLY
ncbi:hypothetical protein L4C33_06435, partial [Vibrio makurazakiensis]|uniref:hypothetical protein n=1 Tax=Vibrio makurazakiensis TaxID=2910250 RepID=UPI003D10B562